MRILFQGDSITDAGRSRDNDAVVGIGYPLLVKASLGFECPGEHEFINKGVSGDRVVEVYARIKRDIINYKPDVMSILVGVNDVWHEFISVKNGIDAKKYYRIYDMLISEIKEALPDIKIMILEPFVLRASATEPYWESFDAGVRERALMARKIAEKHSLTFVELQDGFDALAEKTGASYWLGDGVHPTPMGHEYIKRKWLEAFSAL